MAARCIACFSNNTEKIAHIDNVPVHCVLLLPDQHDALNMPTGALDLVACHACGHVFNAAFDPQRMTYEETYENSLHWSPRFRSYAVGMAQRLITDCALYSKDVLEIGCGRGDFLRTICEAGDNRGLGFDPSAPLDDDPGASARVSLVRDYFDPATHPSSRGDLVICQHVLEHIDDPAGFLDLLAGGLKTADSRLYIEVPNGLATVRDGAAWDLIYEHVSHFCERSLRTLLARRGFAPYWIEETFGGQYLSALAGPDPDARAAPLQGAKPDPASFASFQARLDRLVERWRERLQAIASNARVVVWGAGAKTVSFLNLTQAESRSVETVVDINPHKHGSHIPCSGQRIVAPAELRTIRPDVVLVMNPLYVEEVRRNLDELGVTSDVRSVLDDSG